MDHSRHLIRAWGGGKVILSPRDLNDKQLRTLSIELLRSGGAVLVDPQFYLPHEEHSRLSTHQYWPDDYESSEFWSGSGIKRLLTQVLDLNKNLGCRTFLLPGLYANIVDDDWLWRQEVVIKEARSLNGGHFKLFSTVALSEEATRDSDQIDTILDAANTWEVDGVYLVCEHPRGDYLVGDPIWLANVLDLTAGLRLQRKQVVLGYCHHQMLIAACASATAIASGTWMNVRSFPPAKFRAKYDEEMRTRTTWYYCPPALSEFKIPTMDTALRQGVLQELVTPTRFGSTFADRLFTGPPPSSVGFTEPEAFRHYLQCLNSQVAHIRMPSFEATVDACKQALDESETLLNRLHAVGVYGSNRDFGQVLDYSREAMSILVADRGPLLSRHWQTL